MKKEVTICDKCKRQINEGEQYVTWCIVTSTYDTRTEDVCMSCAFPSNSIIAFYDNYVATGGVVIEPKFRQIINKEF